MATFSNAAEAIPPSGRWHVDDSPSMPPSYQDHMQPPASTGHTGPASSVNSTRLGDSAAGNYVPPSNLAPAPPSYEEFSNRSGHGARRAPSSAVGAEGEPSRIKKGGITAELRRRKWAMFIIGNLISAATIASEISKYTVCFDEYVGDDDDGKDSAEREAQRDSDADLAYNTVMTTLVFGLWVDVFSAFTLSVIYRSPLDIKSAHKISPDDMRHCGGSVMVHFLAPFSWGLIYVVGGVASFCFSDNTSCGGQGGSGVKTYLLVSGVFMLLVGLVLLGISALILPFSCGSPTTRTDRCCAVFRGKVHRAILSKGPYLDVFWQLQGSVWSYRVGGFGLMAALLVGMTGIFGEILSALGSIAPDVVEVLAGLPG